MISSERSGSRLPVGSSARMIAGSLTSARAIAMRCCSPPESSRGYAFIRCWSPDPLQDLEGPTLVLRLRHAEHTRNERDVLEHGFRRQQFEVLKDEPERATITLDLPGRQRRKVAAADDELPFGRHVLAQEQTKQRGFACAAGPGEENEVPFVNPQRQVAKSVDASRIRLRDVDTPRSRGIPVEFAPHESNSPAAGLALPPMDLMTCPTRNPYVCFLPARYCFTASACATSTLLTAASTAPSSSIRASPSASTIACSRSARGIHLFEDVLRCGPADSARVDEPDQARERVWRERHLVDADALLVHLARNVSHDPVAGRFRDCPPRRPLPRSTPASPCDCVSSAAS